MNHSFVLAKVTAVVSLTAALACSDPRPPPPVAPASPAPAAATERIGATSRQAADDTTTVVVEAPAAPAGNAEPPGTPAVMTAAATEAPLPGMSDDQMAGAMLEAFDGTVATAQLAERRADSRDVRRLAHDVATLHIDMQNKLKAQLSKHAMASTDSPESVQLRGDKARELGALRVSRGDAFDARYLEAQSRELKSEGELVTSALAQTHADALKPELTRLLERIASATRLVQQLRASTQPGSR